MTFLVTGAAGFIGFHLCKRLLMDNETVVGIDSMNDYYDINLKKSRLEILYNLKSGNFIFVKEKLENKSKIFDIFQIHSPKYVINLAAQAGVRYSLENPEAYLNSNLFGFLNVLEACRYNDIKHFIYASSSSVYGGNVNMPFSEKQNVDHPVSFYAATKKSNELIAHSYSHLYGIPSTGLRFFTVYGPWGRPDMALFIFTKSIILSEPINVFNNGKMIRDFTYIDDIIESLYRVIKKPPLENDNYDKKNIDPSTSWAPHKIFNIGNSEPVPLMKFIESIENALGKKAKKNFLPMQLGDVASTHADTGLLEKWINYKPNTPIEKGITNFVKWYKEFYK